VRSPNKQQVTAVKAIGGPITIKRSGKYKVPQLGGGENLSKKT